MRSNFNDNSNKDIEPVMDPEDMDQELFEDTGDGEFRLELPADLIMESLFKQATYPFGLQFTNEEMEDFLKQKGYKIKRCKKLLENDEYEYYTVVLLPDEGTPDSSNLEKVFKDVIRKTILKWLLSIK